MKRKYQVVFFLVLVSMFSACATDTDTVIQQVKRNYQPVFASVASNIAQINLAYNYNFTVLDFDTGPLPLSVTVNAADTCGGTLTDNGDGTGNYTFTPTTGQLDTQCVVGLTASDGEAQTEQNTTVDILFINATPAWDSVPDEIVSIKSRAYNSTNGVARTVSAASGTTVTFSPELSSASTAGMLVANWGPGATDLDEDFHLLPGSLCIDADTDVGAPSDDLDGNPRPSPPGGAYDMGAYEYQW